jgi:hypothetical protein
MNLDLDHCGVAVRNLDRGRDAYARLGFRLTSRSFHSGARKPGGPVEPWGSGNHCAMFREGYLEVIGLTDRKLFTSVRDMVGRYEGPHIVAIGCNEDADAAHAKLVQRGLPMESPRALERDAAFGKNDDKIRRAKFRNNFVDRDRYPEGRLLVIEHLTRDVLWQPHLLDHPNGVLGIDECWFASPDAHATARRLEPLSVGPMQVLDAGKGPPGYYLPLARGALIVVDAAHWRALNPGPMPPSPSPVGLGFRVASLARTAALLKKNGVPFGRSARAIAVPASAGCGAAIRFHE